MASVRWIIILLSHTIEHDNVIVIQFRVVHVVVAFRITLVETPQTPAPIASALLGSALRTSPRRRVRVFDQLHPRLA